MTDEVLLSDTASPPALNGAALRTVHGLPTPEAPLLAVAVGLRAPVLGALDRALGRPAAPAAPLPEALDLLTAPLGLDPRRLRSAWSRLLGRLRFVARPEGEPLQLLVAQAAAPDPRPVRGVGTGVYMPVPMWGLVAAMAWDDLGFRREVAARVVSHLREAHLMPSGVAPSVRLAPETCWILLAAGADAGAESLRWWRLGLARRRAVRAQTVQQLASLMALSSPAWAGFWDQWLLDRLLTRTPDLARRLWPELADPLARLPLTAGEQADHPLACAGWAAERPDWMPAPSRVPF
ncbi:hypothetical protein [Azospirillum canadense]|uniref:hypothetical protein n=1 Tax=Azospirillum canadense TaxID=403962 RepID=UPI0022269F54|nr:hypothetical protein [Azospirillum canadense]MCW2243154.1 hypothetical protein [Azospirillum canadense]